MRRGKRKSTGMVLPNRHNRSRSALNASERRIVDALNKSLDIITSTGEKTFDEVMSSGLTPVADAAAIDLIVIYRLLDVGGEKRLGQAYLWDRAKGGTAPLSDDLKILPANQAVTDWFAILSKNKHIIRHFSGMSESERAFLGKFGTKSILMAPVHTNDRLWGIVTFENYTNERRYNLMHVDLLLSAARICANAFIRAETTENACDAIVALTRRGKMLDALNETAITFLSQGQVTFGDMMTAGMAPIIGMFGLDHLSVWRNFSMPDGLHTGQIYCWNRESGGAAAPLPEWGDVSYARFAPRWEQVLSSGGFINSPVKLLPETAMLQSPAAVSVFVTPVFNAGAFWGFVLFEDHHSERYFSGNDIEIMRSASFLCVNTIIRLNMESEIIEAENLADKITEASPFAYLLFSDDLRVLNCNAAALRIFACPDKQYFLDNYWKHFSPEFQPDGQSSAEKANTIRAMNHDQKQIVYEWLHMSLDGELIPMENALTPLVYKGEKYIASFKYDMRNIKKIMESIREHGELLAVRLEQQEVLADIAKILSDKEGIKDLILSALLKLGQYMNASRAVILSIDYENDSLRVECMWRAAGAPDFASRSSKLAHLVTGNFPPELPESILIPTIVCNNAMYSPHKPSRALADMDIGGYIWSPIYIEGMLWGIISVEQCNAPRSWTEDEKGFVATGASMISNAIMRDIYNTRLTAALERMTAASKAKSEFLSNMSHEMRTPLNAIIGMTSIGKSSKDITRKDYALEKVEDASLHLLGVIDDVLDMSKIEANKLELSPVEFDFERMLQKVVAVINFRIEEKRHRFSMSVDHKIPPFVIGDDQRLSQVVTNLLSNAVKFTPDGGHINLAASLAGEEDGICEVRIEVSDSGIGISPEQQLKLFQAFGQAESGTSRKFGGTGLGLAISKRITELMGGGIRVESELEKGSRFIFTVKLPRSRKNLHSLLDPGVNWETLRILVVDDDEGVLEYFKRLFSSLSVQCETASDGLEAYRLIEEHGEFDIYFIDWHIPFMDGIELTRRIKAREMDRMSVVTMISSASWADIREEAITAGVDKHLTKPLLASSVIDCINMCLGITGAHRGESDTSDNEFTGKRILLAEDLDINREILISLLDDTGLIIDCAENGKDALNIVEASPGKYDLVFMDVQMPIMDGLEATKRIRALPSPYYGELPIIAMTANVFKDDITDCLESGMNDHIGKPLDISNVIEKLRKFLSPK